jgi:signal transduction histidine kinase
MNAKLQNLTENLQRRERLQDAKQCMGCMHEGVLVTLMDGTIVEMTPAAEHIFEIPSVGARKRNIHEFCVVQDIYDDMRSASARDGRSMNRSLLVLTGTGKKKLLNMSIQHTDDAEGARLVHVFQDCSDLRTMEQRLLQSERLATVGRFASQIAHEIRNPLNSISLNVELLGDELKNSNQEAQSLISSVLRELDRLNDIVGEYLQFSRFPKPNLKRGEIEGVIRDVQETFRPPDRITFTVHESPATPSVWLDEKLLRQVIDNLTRNAVEAIEGEGTIDIETDVIDRFVVIRVKDTGDGIPADAQKKLFEPFFTTKPHGTGLGLATSQQIIFEHNGHLLVESQVGKGSVFSILLPI